MSQFDQYFSNGLVQPPTSREQWMHFFSPIHSKVRPSWSINHRIRKQLLFPVRHWGSVLVTVRHHKTRASIRPGWPKDDDRKSHPRNLTFSFNSSSFFFGSCHESPPAKWTWPAGKSTTMNELMYFLLNRTGDFLAIVIFFWTQGVYQFKLRLLWIYQSNDQLPGVSDNLGCFFRRWTRGLIFGTPNLEVSCPTKPWFEKWNLKPNL